MAKKNRAAAGKAGGSTKAAESAARTATKALAYQVVDCVLLRFSKDEEEEHGAFTAPLAYKAKLDEKVGAAREQLERVAGAAKPLVVGEPKLERDKKIAEALDLFYAVMLVLQHLSRFAYRFADGSYDDCPVIQLVHEMVVEIAKVAEPQLQEKVLSVGSWATCVAFSYVARHMARYDDNPERSYEAGLIPFATFYLDFLERRCGIEDVLGESRGRAVERSFLKSGMDYRVNGTPLSTAAYYGNAALVDFLLKRGADPNNRWASCAMSHPLLTAYSAGDAACFKRLLEGGSRVTAPAEVLARWEEGPMRVCPRSSPNEDCRKPSVWKYLDLYHDELPSYKDDDDSDDDEEDLEASEWVLEARREMLAALFACEPDLVNSEKVFTDYVSDSDSDDDDDDNDDEEERKEKADKSKKKKRNNKKAQKKEKPKVKRSANILLLHKALVDYSDDVPLLKVFLDAGVKFRPESPPDEKNDDVFCVGTAGLVARELECAEAVQLLVDRGLFKQCLAETKDCDEALDPVVNSFIQRTLRAMKERDNEALRAAKIILADGFTRVMFEDGAMNMYLSAVIGWAGTMHTEALVLPALKFYRSNGVDIKTFSTPAKGNGNLLHLACIRGFEGVARFAIKELGCSVNDITTPGFSFFGSHSVTSPLGYALQKGHSELAMRLLEDYHAPPFIPGLDASSQPLMMAVGPQSGLTDEEGASFIKAFLRRDPSLLDRPCFRGTDGQSVDELFGREPLLGACYYPQSGVARATALLETGNKHVLASLNRLVRLGKDDEPSSFGNIASILCFSKAWPLLALVVSYGASVARKWIVPAGQTGTALEPAAKAIEGSTAPRQLKAAILAAAKREVSAKGAPSADGLDGAAAAPEAVRAPRGELNMPELPPMTREEKLKAKRIEQKKKARAKKRQNQAAGGAAAGAGAAAADEVGSSDDESEEDEGPQDFARYAPDITAMVERMRLEAQGDDKGGV